MGGWVGELIARLTKRSDILTEKTQATLHAGPRLAQQGGRALTVGKTQPPIKLPAAKAGALADPQPGAQRQQATIPQSARSMIQAPVGRHATTQAAHRASRPQTGAGASRQACCRSLSRSPDRGARPGCANAGRRPDLPDQTSVSEPRHAAPHPEIHCPKDEKHQPSDHPATASSPQTAGHMVRARVGSQPASVLNAHGLLRLQIAQPLPSLTRPAGIRQGMVEISGLRLHQGRRTQVQPPLLQVHV